MYAALQDNLMAYAGLYQAYLLMTIIAVLTFRSSGASNTRPWHITLILAHLAPLSVVLLNWAAFGEIGYRGVSYISLGIHGVFITLETLALLSTFFAPTAEG